MAEKSIEENEAYWDEFYQQEFVHIPSQFCALVAARIAPASTIVELGCGNGRDSHFFASAQFSVLGIDLSPTAIEACSAFNSRGKIKFLCADISNVEACKNIARQVVRAEDEAITFYSRFVMHSLDDTQEAAFMRGLNHLMQKGDSIYFEFRSKEDHKTKKFYDNHYRRYIDTAQFIEKLTCISGLEVLYQITGKGMALYRDEDPWVSRVIARKT